MDNKADELQQEVFDRLRKTPFEYALDCYIKHLLHESVRLKNLEKEKK